jgi:anaphase-promoting complex subunit 4
LEPATLEVNGRKGRRVACVLYADRSRYSVFDLDTVGGEEGDEMEYDGEVEDDGDQVMED